MDPKTLDHLRIAARNRDLARALLDPAMRGLEPPPWEWIAVMAFYAAVHMVNAYLWESGQYAPANHGDRRTAMQVASALIPCMNQYGALNATGYRARYDERYSVSELHARTLLVVQYRRVEATVMQALGQPVPVW